MREQISAPNDAASPVYGELIEISEKHLDVWGHANNVCYIQWMQDVAVAHSAALGWDARRYLEHEAMWVVRRHSIDYARSLYLGDKALVQTWIAEMKLASCIRRYRFLALPPDVTDDEIQQAVGFCSLVDFSFPKSALVATAETHWAFVSTNTLRPFRVFPELNAVFEKPRDSFARYPLRGV